MLRCSPGREVDIIDYLIPVLIRNKKMPILFRPRRSKVARRAPNNDGLAANLDGRFLGGGAKVRRRALRVEGESISGAASSN